MSETKDNLLACSWAQEGKIWGFMPAIGEASSMPVSVGTESA